MRTAVRSAGIVGLTRLLQFIGTHRSTMSFPRIREHKGAGDKGKTDSRGEALVLRYDEIQRRNEKRYIITHLRITNKV